MKTNTLQSCDKCGGELEEDGVCENFLCPEYVPPAPATRTLPTYTIRIYLSGSIEAAKQVIREHVLERPLCVTVEPTTFIYTGGEEQGYVVGLLNYPRFPTAPNELNVRANILAELLLERTFQRSALIVTPTDTKWITRESLTP